MLTFLVPQVTQTEPTNCVSACLSAVLCKPIAIVTAEFDSNYANATDEPHDYLRRNTMPFRHCLAGERQLFGGNIYMAAVPSLNVVGGLHEVLIQVGPNSDYWFVMDPNLGRHGVLCYGNFTGAVAVPEGFVNLENYMLEYEFRIEDVEERHMKGWNT